MSIERQKYIAKKYIDYPNIIKFKEVMNMAKQSYLKKLCTFISYRYFISFG